MKQNIIFFEPVRAILASKCAKNAMLRATKNFRKNSIWVSRNADFESVARL
jgi:hypothetical protein